MFLNTALVVSDSLEYSPEKCTVVATYRHLVVGVAILSSPQETYLTYIAVRAGWEDAGIATLVFLFWLWCGRWYVLGCTGRCYIPWSRETRDAIFSYTFLPTVPPWYVAFFSSRDSLNFEYVLIDVCPSLANQILYNRFGFKAEEFIVGFYEAYLDSQSRGSKNAFRMRLRR